MQPKPPSRPRRRRGALSEEDRAIWEAYARVVRPLEGRAVPAAAAEPAAAKQVVVAPVAAEPVPVQVKMPAAPVSVGVSPGGLDRATWQKLRSGKLAVERTLDLHGQTAARAHRALQGFLTAAQAEGVRCVEVITGRGGGGGGGVLRRELPMWLNAPDVRPLVLAVVHPHARNQGAVRILLRRRRG
jgi:DNA-nicking Smr family endonuclease